MAVPLAVEVELKEPHEELPQVTVQLTPLVSLVTTAVSVVVALVLRERGGAGLKATEMGGAATVMVADADAVEPEEVVAVTVTLVGVEGAV